MVAHAFNPSTLEAEAGGSLSSRPAWSTELVQDSQGYTEKSCLQRKKKRFIKVKNCSALPGMFGHPWESEEGVQKLPGLHSEASS